MHVTRNRILFFGSALAVGFAMLGLHNYMMANCFDHKGLLIAGNLPMKLLWVLGVGFAVFLGALVTTIGGEGSYADNFPQCTRSGLLMIAAGLVLGYAAPDLGLQPVEPTAFVAPMAAGFYRLVGRAMEYLPWLANLAMVVLGVFRLLGKKPLGIFSAVVCMFYMMMLVNNYRLWSADPKFHEYALPMLAGVLLMLSAFHRTCCDNGVIQRKKLLFTGLSAAVCAIASMSTASLTGFFASAALWSLGSMCSPAVLPPDPEEEEEAAEEPAETEE